MKIPYGGWSSRWIRACAAGGAILSGVAVLGGFQSPRETTPGAPARVSDVQRNAPACDADNGGITLPAGFCATVFADGLGAARHMAVSAHGDVYVAIQRGRTPVSPAGVAVLRDSDGDGKVDKQEFFGPYGGGGIAISGNHLFLDNRSMILRYTLTKGAMVPATPPDTIVTDLPANGGHSTRDLAVDGKGNLYVNVGSATNVCEVPRSSPLRGVDPCVELETRAGVWKFSDSTVGQKFSRDTRFVTGLRNGVGLRWSTRDNALYSTQHGRDALTQSYPQLFDAKKSAENPAEELMRLEAGDDFGWPYCYYDNDLKRRVLAPEYGGDSRTAGRCATKKTPLVAFPGHWAPNALEFYTGTKFPAKYRDGAFVAFHGSWNRSPEPQAGFRVTFAPARQGKYDGSYETFAGGFPGRATDPAQGAYRPTGLLTMPDGSLLVSDDKTGRIWKIVYTR